MTKGESRQRRFSSGTDLLDDFWNDPLDYSGPQDRRPRTRVLSTVTFALIGVVLAAAYVHTVAAAPGASDARAELREDITSQRADNRDKDAQADELRSDVARLRDDLIGSQREVQRLHNAEALAGLREVSGDGATVTLADGPSPEDPSSSDPGKVLDKDLQLAVNTLWAYRAEAVAIDGHRLTATSTIRAAGDAIMVNTAPVSSPYEITAIGPDELADSFQDSPAAATFHEYDEKYGMSISVNSSSDFRLPAASAPALDNATVGKTN